MARIARVVVVVVVATLAGACSQWARSPRFGTLPVESRNFEFNQRLIRFEVNNGAQGAIITDPRTNLVTIDVRYTVGSAEDPPGKGGMAHLAEHLMFDVRDEEGGPTLFERLSDLSLDFNAYTAPDQTHYTTTAQPQRLGDILALEASRLREPCAHLDDATFLRERDVVVAEELERADPSAHLLEMVMADVFGARHPYARSPIDTEVASITRDEACAFMAAHYAPDRAIVVVTGPLDARFVQTQVGQAFGPISRHSTRKRVTIEAPSLAGTYRHTADVEDATAIVMFEGAPWRSDRAVELQLAAVRLDGVLSSAAAKRDWIKSTVVASVGGARARVTAVAVSVDDPARLQDAADLVLDQAPRIYDDLDPHTVSRVRGSMRLDYVAGWDRVSTRGDWIADYIQLTDHNEFMVRELTVLDKLDTAKLRSPFTRDMAAVVLVAPSGKTARLDRFRMATSGRDHDLPPWRTPVDAAEAQRPLAVVSSGLARRVERYQLANGLTVELAPDPRSPIVDARIVFPVGSAQDPPDRPGLAWAAAYLLDHDYERTHTDRDANKIRWAIDLGTQQSAGVDETTTVLAVRGTNTFTDWHLWRLSWLLDQGYYNKAFIDGLRTAARAAKPDKVSAAEIDYRAHLFGKDHPYARPPTPPRALLAITDDDLVRWRRDHFQVKGATLVVSGGFDAETIKGVITELFAPLPADPPVALRPVPRPTPQPGAHVLAVHDDSALQVRTRIGFTARSSTDDDRAARRVLATIVADRLRSIRESMGASYGVEANYRTGAAASVFEIDGRVDPAKAGEALTRLLGELATIRSAGDGFTEDFVRARRRVMARVMAQSGGAQAVAAELTSLAADGRSVDDRDKMAAAIARLTPEDVAAVAKSDLDIDHMVLQLIGPAAAVDAAVGAINAAPTAAAAK